MECKKVLFADDDADFREFMQDAIVEINKTLGMEFELTAASDGAEAIKIFDNSSFDFILTDYKMPKATAVDVIRHVVHTNPVPVIVISGFKEAETVDFVAEGAIIFVTKPFSYETMCEAFQTAVSLTISEADLTKAKAAVEKLEKLIS